MASRGLKGIALDLRWFVGREKGRRLAAGAQGRWGSLPPNVDLSEMKLLAERE